MTNPSPQMEIWRLEDEISPQKIDGWFNEHRLRPATIAEIQEWLKTNEEKIKSGARLVAWGQCQTDQYGLTRVSVLTKKLHGGEVDAISHRDGGWLQGDIVLGLPVE